MAINAIIKHFNISEPKNILSLDSAHLAPDFIAELFKADELQYVLIEIDYLSGMPGIVNEVQNALHGKVEGWCTLKRPDVVVDFLPANVDDYDPDGTNDVNHKNYTDTVLTLDGMCYAILKVA